MHDCHVFDVQLQLTCVKLNLRVCHTDRLQSICLGGQRLFLILEVIDLVGQVTSFDLLTTIVVYLLASFENILFAESNQAQVLVKVFLLAHDPGFFNLECLCILELDLCSLLQDHVNDSVEVLIDLSHHLDLPFLHVLPQLRSLVNQVLGAPAELFQVVHDLFTVLLEYED